MLNSNFFHNRSSNRYNRLKTGHRFHLRCHLRGGGRNRNAASRDVQYFDRPSCLVAGIRSPSLHSVACLYSRGSQVAIEFGLGRRIRGDAGRYKLQWRRHQTCRSAGARAGVRQRVGRGRGRPKAVSVLSARWRLGAVSLSVANRNLTFECRLPLIETGHRFHLCCR